MLTIATKWMSIKSIKESRQPSCEASAIRHVEGLALWQHDDGTLSLSPVIAFQSLGPLTPQHSNYKK